MQKALLCFVKGQVYSFASVYVPNTRQISFIDGILNKLSTFMAGVLEFGGDFNLSLDQK